MNNHICTLFDKNFLFKGLTLYRSFIEHSEEGVFWVLCMDEESHSLLSAMNLERLKLLKLEDLENAELCAVKPDRNAGEYSWTLKPYLIRHILDQPQVSTATYLDADTFFFGDPKTIYKELGENSVLLTPHNFPGRLEHIAHKVGNFNAGFLLFRNDEKGRACLEDWRKKCLEWCFHRTEGAKYGDQYYLNEMAGHGWNVKHAEHKGINAGPWNIEKYAVAFHDRQIFVNDEPLVLYHFHKFSIHSKTSFTNTIPTYHLQKNTLKYIYKTYKKAIADTMAAVWSLDTTFKYGLVPAPRLRTRVKRFIQTILKRK